MDQQQKRKVALCATTTISNDATINFATMVLNIPYECKIDLSIDFTATPQTSYEAFLQSDSDVFVCIPTYMDSIDFFRACSAWEAGDAWNAIVGTFTQPTLDWQKGESKPRLSYYPPVQNIDSASSAPYVDILMSEIPPCFAVRKTDSMPATLWELFGNHDKYKVCVDTKNTLSVFAKNVFVGCVGLRGTVR